MSTKDLVEEIETYIMVGAANSKTRTAREVVAFCERQFGVTQYDATAALRRMKMAGALIETDGKLYLQRGLGFD